MYIIKDLITFIKFKFSQKKFRIGFFQENKNIQPYLIPYIMKKALNEKIFIMSIDDLDLKNIKNVCVYVFKSKLFIELFFLTLKVKYLYSSTPDLNNSLFMKSKLGNCRYIYLQHSPVSISKAYNNNAFDNFDAVQVVNKFQYEEIHANNFEKKLKIKAFKSKYVFFNSNFLNQEKKIKYDVLIAPTWKSNFYKLNCHKTLIDNLNNKNITYKLRPHYMSFKKNEIDRKTLLNNKIILDENLIINFYDFKFLVSDWSGIFIEYSILRKIKSFLINTPQKKLNTSNKNLNSTLEEISRDYLANLYNIDQIEKLVNDIHESKYDDSGYKNDKEQIENYYKKYFY